MSASVFGLETWVSRVHLIMICFSFEVGGFSWNHPVECAARCGLGLLAQPCTQLRFILFTPGIVWSTFQTVAASVTDPSCNCVKGISTLRKHHSWISPSANWDSSMSLIKDGTFGLYLLCSKQKSLSFYNLHFTICHVFPPSASRRGVCTLNYNLNYNPQPLWHPWTSMGANTDSAFIVFLMSCGAKSGTRALLSHACIFLFPP